MFFEERSITCSIKLGKKIRKNSLDLKIDGSTTEIEL